MFPYERLRGLLTKATADVETRASPALEVGVSGHTPAWTSTQAEFWYGESTSGIQTAHYVGRASLVLARISN